MEGAEGHREKAACLRRRERTFRRRRIVGKAGARRLGERADRSRHDWPVPDDRGDAVRRCRQCVRKRFTDG